MNTQQKSGSFLPTNSADGGADKEIPNMKPKRIRFAGAVIATTLLSTCYLASYSPSTAATSAAAMNTQILAIGHTTELSTLPMNGRVVPTNWFSDWQTCIWGIGIPTALAGRGGKGGKGSGKAGKVKKSHTKEDKLNVKKLLSKKGTSELRKMYGDRVIDACARFIRS